MRHSLAFCSAVILAACAVAAPLPRQRSRPMPSPRPHAGIWVMHWAGGRYDVVLRQDGTYAASPGDWQGYWSWDEKKRLWRVQETTNEGATWLDWTVPLDANLRGEGVFTTGGKVDISLAENTSAGGKL